MNPTQMIGLAINASMFMIVFSLGLHATFNHMTYLFRNPGLFFRSILAMNIIMLAFAVVVILIFDLPAPVKIALIALAVSPVPPVLPDKQMKVGGTIEHTIGLLAGAAVVSIPLVPLSIYVLGQKFGFDTHAPIGKVTSIVMISIVVPLLAGALLRKLMPAFAERIAKPVSLFATALLVVAFLPVLIKTAPVFWSLVGSGALLCLAGFTLVGITVGHILGGPRSDYRAILGLACGTRHPGIALAIAAINFPEETRVLSVVLFHLIIGAVVSVPYVKWQKHLFEAKQGAH